MGQRTSLPMNTASTRITGPDPPRLSLHNPPNPKRALHTKAPLSAFEKLPFELFEQVITQIPSLWQASLLRSSPHLWKLHKTYILTDRFRRTAFREFCFDFDDQPYRVFCFECEELQLWRLPRNEPPECPHSMGHRPAGGGRLDLKHPKTLPNPYRLHQSIRIGIDKTTAVSFLQYRKLLQTVCLRPRRDRTYSDGLDPAYANIVWPDWWNDGYYTYGRHSNLDFASLAGGMVVRSTAFRAAVPLARPVGQGALTFIKTGKYPVHVCHGYVDEEEAERFNTWGSSPAETSMEECVNHFLERAMLTPRFASSRNTFRCDRCVVEILVCIIGPNVEVDKAPSWTLSNPLADKLHTSFGVQVSEYTWLGAALVPHELPQNQIELHPGLSEEEMEKFPCMEDGFEGLKRLRLHAFAPDNAGSQSCAPEGDRNFQSKDNGLNGVKRTRLHKSLPAISTMTAGRRYFVTWLEPCMQVTLDNVTS